MARTERTRRGAPKVSGDAKLLRSAVSSFQLATENVEKASGLVVKSGHADAQRMDAALGRIVRRLTGLSQRIDPDAVNAREKARTLKRISALEQKVAELKASLEEK